jgi:E1A/CREB-binding protein
MNCPNQRIGRNRNFYIAGSGSNCYYWCTKCYDELDAAVKIDLPDLQETKADLKRKKNDEVIPESWVECDDCKRWVHYLCSLFNCRQNKDASSKFSCPYCLIKDLKSGKITPLSNAASAEELPRTTLSEYLEDYVGQRISAKYDEMAKEKADTEVCFSFCRL